MIKNQCLWQIGLSGTIFGPRISRSKRKPDNRKPLKGNSETLFWDVG